MLTRRAPIGRPVSVDLEAGTAVAVLSVGATVPRHGFRPDGSFGPWRETLDVRGVDLSRVPVPLLLDHRSTDSAARIGVVADVAVRGHELVGALRFSRREQAQEMLADAADLGAALSVGYRVSSWQRDGGEREEPIWRAAAWELVETSIVNVPADAAARIRALEGTSMDPEQNTTERPAPPAANLPSPPSDAGGAVADQVRQARDDVRRVYQACRLARVDNTIGDQLLERMSPDAACRELLDRAAQRDAADEILVRAGETDHGDPSAIAGRMQAALLHRADPGRYQLPPEAVEFRGLSLVEMRRRLLEANGVNCRGWMPDRVLGYRHEGWMRRSGGLMTTSDLPNLLTATGNRILEDSYQMARSPLAMHSRERTASDFRAISSLRAGNISPLELVNEHGEVTRGAAAEAKESFKVSTYAKIWGFTREAIINDDLGALTDWTQEMGAAAGETEASLFVALLTANSGAGVLLEDGTALFHANHGNLASPGTAIDVTNVGAGRQAMREQTGLGGVFPIQVAPVAILVSPAKEVEAEQVTVALTPAQVGETNPFSGKLRVEVEVRLTGNGWYLFSENPVFQHAYLNGQRGPMLETKDGWDVLGVEFRAVLDIGVGVRDFRFAYRNPGA